MRRLRPKTHKKRSGKTFLRLFSYALASKNYRVRKICLRLNSSPDHVFCLPEPDSLAGPGTDRRSLTGLFTGRPELGMTCTHRSSQSSTMLKSLTLVTSRSGKPRRAIHTRM